MKHLALVIFFTHMVTGFTSSASSNESVQVDNQRANQWNTFVDDVYQLHLKQIENKKIATTNRSGSYHRLPDFFQEIKFLDTSRNLLLSKIEWETKRPDKIHSIEVRVHDDNNNIIREYSASYLPDFRNAPYQTLINIHHYSESLHSFRQYDASNNLIYEVCRATKNNEKLFEHDDYEIPDNFTQGIGKDKTYQKCFQQLVSSNTSNITPH